MLHRGQKYATLTLSARAGPVVAGGKGGKDQSISPTWAAPELVGFFALILPPPACRFAGVAPSWVFSCPLFPQTCPRRSESVGVQVRPSLRKAWLDTTSGGTADPATADVAKTPATALVNTRDSRSQCDREGQVPVDDRVTGKRGSAKPFMARSRDNRVIRSRLAERYWYSHG